ELFTLAITDPLTDLKNRRALFEFLEQEVDQARRTELCCAAFVIDIDNFKEVNDLLGHEAGDELLTTIARRISEALRKADTIGGLGGVEFAVIAPDVKSPTGAIELAEKISAAVNSAPHLGESAIRTWATTGIAVFPSDGLSAGTIVSR